MRILLLSAYHAASHEQWANGLIKNFSEHDWSLLTLPPRYFNWRIRGNSLTWAFTEQQALSQPYDLILATSMVDLSALRGMVPALTSIPTLVYFHENQFYYPISKDKQTSDSKSSSNNSQVEAQLTSIYSALCADTVVFNSQFNRDSFLSRAEKLLKKLPDGVPPNIITLLKDKSHVIPVPIDDDLFLPRTNTKNDSSQLTIVWNHRWEYDKGPDRLLTVLKKITPECPLTFHILGQSFRNIPSEFTAIKQLLIENQWLGEWGYIDSREKYIDVLKRSDAVLSTALHDFQGISILEAVATGCTPIVPNRLAYPELFSQETLYDSCFDHEKGNFSDPKKIDLEAITLSKKIESLAKQFLSGKAISQKQTIDPLSWARMKSKYSEAFEKTIHQE